MKTTINSKLTRAGIKFVTGVIGRKNLLPILDNVLIHANGTFQVTATDLDVTLQARLSGQTVIEGKTTLPGVRLADAVTGGADIELETNEKHVTTMRDGAAVRSVNGLSPDEFPTLSEMPVGAASLSLPADGFLACLRAVELAQSTDESRYVLNGVCLEIKAECVHFIATDGRRLQTAVLATGAAPVSKEDEAAIAKAQKALDTVTDAAAAAQKRFDEELAKNPPTFTAVEVPAFGTLYRKEDHACVKSWQSIVDENSARVTAAQAALAKTGAGRTILLPRASVKHILRIPLNKKVPGMLTLSDWTVGKDKTPMARIDCGEFTVTTRGIVGNYLCWKQVVPAETNVAVPMEIESFRKALAIAEKATTEKQNSVKLAFSKGNLDVTANAVEMGETKVSVACGYNEVDADGADKPLSIAFNPRYLIDACDSFDAAGDHFTLNFIDELSPVKITNAGGQLCVVMPMRLN